jgi:hypothetical protein
MRIIIYWERKGACRRFGQPPKTIPVQLSTQAGLELNPPVPTHEGMTFALTRCVAIYMALMAYIGTLCAIKIEFSGNTKKYIDIIKNL